MHDPPQPTPGRPHLQTSRERRETQALTARAAVVADRTLWWAGTGAAAWVVLFALLTWLTSGPTATGLAGTAAYVVAAGLTLCVAVRTAGRTRLVWALLAASTLLWLAGEVVRLGYLSRGGDVPYPSAADGLFLLSYALVPPALVLAFAGMGMLRQMRGLGDAGFVAAALGIAAWRLFLAPQLGDGTTLAGVISAAYPLLGIVVLGVLASVGRPGHRLATPGIVLLGASFACSAVSDVVSSYATALDLPLPLGWVDLGWQLQVVLLCLAAVVVLRHGSDVEEAEHAVRQFSVAPVAGGVAIVMALVSVEAWERGVSLVVLALALVAAVYVVLRFSLVIHEQRGLTQRLQDALDEQERLAISDGLTGLHNRRFFTEMLRLEAERAGREQRPLALLVLDLDHFKQVNDRYGHVLGDDVLVETARRLRACARSTDVLARYGGEEFVLLLPGRDEHEVREIGERCRQALRFRPFTAEDGAWIRVTVSVGCAVAGGPGQSVVDPESLVLDADRALYLAKDLGRDRVVLHAEGRLPGVDHRERLPLLTTTLPSGLVRLAQQVETLDGLPGHSRRVASWAAAVAHALSLTALERSRLILAAHLHDIGKIAVPEDVLTTTEGLDPSQWALLRRHPEVGALVVGTTVDLADVARIVSHLREKYDGTGYPRGRAGQAIPVESRVLAVCDAWAAIRQDRPQGPARTVEMASAELAAGRGTQFDPAVVDAFLGLVDRDLVVDDAAAPEHGGTEDGRRSTLIA